MILRRLTQHIREQNWFAVGLDFIIVVVGIFVGLQVSQWSASQADRVQEYVVLERMHDEIMSILERRERVVESGERDIAMMVSAFPALMPDSEIETLSQAQCRAIVTSHIYLMPTPSLMVIDEMQATGGLQLVSNPELKTSILKFIQASRAAVRLLSNVNNSPFHLANRYPDLIEYTFTDQTGLQDPMFENELVCDLAGMRDSPAFRNDFADSVSRNMALVSVGNAAMLEALQGLHASLDVELGHSHEDTDSAQPVSDEQG